MLYDEFIKKVKEYAGLDSSSDAIAAADAVLETLGERLTRIHRQHLATQLPRELQPAALRARETDRIPLEQFYIRVGARTGRQRVHEAIKRSDAVIRVLQEAVAEGELADILSDMPAEYQALFNKRASGPQSPPIVDVHRIK
ncbi:MAG: DUF2267 domain-containing protein [Chloroflexi bacterium]|nr:DUF2267 domain-containing protein [Chloroflexota bacterium]